MKLRRENSGLHMFDRESGIHVLLEEIRYSNSLLCKSPRTVSIALTNRCDLHCDFCYAPKGRQMIKFADLQNLVVALDNCGVLEITLGGGEPLLHPEFIDICKWIWERTSMATSVTTHGHHLTSEFIRRLTGRLSSIRFSIDGLEPYYSSVRGRPLSHLLPIVTLARQSIFTGINIVVSPGKLIETRRVLDLAIDLQVGNVLLIPKHDMGRFLLTSNDWIELDDTISFYMNKIQLNITHDAATHLTSKCLPIEDPNEFLFAHISANLELKSNSYDSSGIPIIDVRNINHYFSILSNNFHKGLN